MSTTPDAASRGQAGRDVAIQVGARVLNLAIGVGVTVLLARALGEEGFGEWSTILVVVQLAAYFTSFGVEGVVVREAAADPEREDEWLGALLILRALLSVPGVLVGLVVVLLIHDNSSMLIAGLILLAQTPFNVGASLRVVHQLRVRNWFPMVVLTLNSVLWAAAVVAIYLLDGGVVALAIAMTVIGALTATLQALAAIKIAKPNLRPTREATMRLARVGVPVGIAGLLVLAYAKIDQVLVFAIGGSTDAGLYGAAYRIVEQAQLVPTSLLTTLLPILTASWAKDRLRTKRIAWLSAEYLTVASLGGLAVALVVSEQLTSLLYGADFAAAGPALAVLSGAFVFICFGYLTTSMILIVGQQRLLVIVGIIGLLVNVAGNLILIPLWGFMGAAWMTLLTEGVIVLVTALMLKRDVGLGAPDLRRMARVVLAAAILAGLLLGLREAGLPLAGLLAASAVVYPLLVVTVGGLSVAELRGLIRSRGAALAQ
jgi:O-antigen/teichoic acid export membrane protein